MAHARSTPHGRCELLTPHARPPAARSADGAISKADFLEFMRRSLVADLPAARMDRVHELFAEHAARREDGSNRLLLHLHRMIK